MQPRLQRLENQNELDGRPGYRGQTVILSPARIEARDRRKTAAHEAGHLVIARYVGIPSAAAAIWRVREINIRQSAWIGQASCGMERASRKRRIMCGLAGAIGERVLYPEPD